jgi:hypothetical protein
VSLTPFWNGIAVRTSNTDANVGQLGLSLTVPKFTEPARPVVTPVSQPPRDEGYRPVNPAPAPPPPAARSDTTSTPHPDVGKTRLPSGTNYIGDTRLKLYYPVGCASQHAIPPQYQVLFQTSAGAERDGFKLSGDC